MEQHHEALEWRGRTAVDVNGDKLGKIDEIYLDYETGTPEWALVDTGMFGKSTFVPLRGASADDDNVRMRHSKDEVKDAPKVSAADQLSQDEEAELYRHYGLDYPQVPQPEAGAREGEPQRPAEGRTAPRAEEGTPRAEAGIEIPQDRQRVGRTRLRKYVVTEQVTVTVPVQREELRLEHEPADDDQAADAASSRGEGEVILPDDAEVVSEEPRGRSTGEDRGERRRRE